MNADERSLRLLVEKWLTPTPAMPVRVTEFGRIASNQRRYVRIEAMRPAGLLVLFSFGTVTDRGTSSHPMRMCPRCPLEACGMSHTRRERFLQAVPCPVAADDYQTPAVPVTEEFLRGPHGTDRCWCGECFP